MIKKILPFLLVVALMLSFALSPVRAKASMGYSVDLLDFVSVNSNGNSVFTFTSSGTAQFDISSTLVNLRSYSFDILLQYSGAAPSSYSVSRDQSLYFDTTVTDLESGIVRLTGSFAGYVVDNFCIDFVSSGTSYITFLSFDVCISSVDRIDLGTTLKNGGGGNATLTPGGAVRVYSLPGATSSMFSFSIPYSVWSCYDYIDFSGYIANGEISSIVAYTSDTTFIPIDTSVFVDMSQRSVYYYSCRLDLSQDNMVNTGALVVWASAAVIADAGEFGLWGLSGVLLGDEYDSVNTWFQIVTRRLDSIRSYLTTVNSTISNSCNRIYNFLYNNLVNMLSTINTSVSSGFNTVISKLSSAIDLLQELVDGNNVNNDTMTDIEQGSSDLGGMSQEMGELTPEIDVETVTVPLDDIVSAEDQVSTNNLMLTIVDNQIITNFLLISVSFALMGFVFFGKR